MRKRAGLFLSILLMGLLGVKLLSATEPAGNNAQTLLLKIEHAEHNQGEIFKQLAEIKTELEVVKIRVSLNTRNKKK